MIPYGKQTVDEDDVKTVAEVLRSDFLTQGPFIEKFEAALAAYCGVRYAVVVNSGTAALHAAYAAIELQKDDEFITTALTFPATANAGLWQGARPVFVDVDLSTGNIDPTLIEQKITKKTKAIVPVDYTGRPADLNKIKEIAKKYNLPVIEDACQALGAKYYGKKIGSISDLTVFSFHPVKSITTGEGGAILTDNETYYRRMKMFITHGVTKKDFTNQSDGPWYFEMQMLGQNYRLTDFQSALGLSQLKKLDSFIEKRSSLVQGYNEAFQNIDNLILPALDTAEVVSAWHLYVIRLRSGTNHERAALIEKLRAAGIAAAVHHIPVYRHPYYVSLGYQKADYPNTELFYETCITLPLYPTLTESDQKYVVEQVKQAVL